MKVTVLGVAILSLLPADNAFSFAKNAEYEISIGTNCIVGAGESVSVNYN